MKIINRKKIENCLEGKNVWDLLFDEPISKGFIFYLGQLGKIKYQPFFPKPFFTLIVKGKFTLKGSENNSSARLLLPDDAEANTIIFELEKYILEYSN